jgi:hypothetical protein
MIKRILCVIAIALAMVWAAPPAAALTQEGLAVNVPYTVTNVTSVAFVQLVASTVKGIAGLTVLNLGAAPIQLALGASGSEVVQMIVPAQSGSTAGPTFYPLSAGYGSRISVEALGTNNTTGSLEVNLFYN